MKKIFVIWITVLSCGFCMAQGSANFIDDLRNRIRKGDIEAMYMLGGMSRYENPELTARLFLEAAQKGHPMAMKEVGDMYYKGGVWTWEPDYKNAFEWYYKAAEKGITESINMLGNMYYNGKGVQQDKGKALVWYTKAAEKGLTLAMYNLGGLYYELRDYKMAFKWHSKVIENRGLFEDNSKCYLGQMYYKGEGVQQDYKKAYDFFNAAEYVGGYAKGFLSEMYYNGFYVSKDYFKAFELAKEGAEYHNQPSGTAMRILSACYRYGLGGTAIDNEKAEHWLKESADHDDEKAMRIYADNQKQ